MRVLHEGFSTAKDADRVARNEIRANFGNPNTGIIAVKINKRNDFFDVVQFPKNVPVDTTCRNCGCFDHAAADCFR